MIAAIIFPIIQYIITVLINSYLDLKIMKFMPVTLRYFFYFYLNCCIEGFKAGLYYINSENSFANFHFIIFIFFDTLMHIAKKNIKHLKDVLLPDSPFSMKNLSLKYMILID